jgi:hypothetical protein
VELEKVYAAQPVNEDLIARILLLCDLAFQVICQMREPWVENVGSR